MTTAWNYATIAFQPYPDVGEFINIGVLALAVPARILAYRLLPAQSTARVHGFFPELDLSMYRDARKRIENELMRLEEAVNHQGEGKTKVTLGSGQASLPMAPGQESALFTAITACRDGVIRFHPKGTRMAADADQLLDVLFERFVTRVTAEASDPEETRLVHEVGSMLQQWKLRALYRKNLAVGPDAFRVKFPFGYIPADQETPQKVIKPLNLDQATSTQIYHHGDMWLANLTRLKRLGALPPGVLLPVKMPLSTRGASRDAVRAAEEIFEQLENARVTVIESGNRDAMRRFAEIPQPTDLTLQS